MDEELVRRLKKFGMNEYEAKVYAALFGLRVASAREIHEFTQIPRGRVYETKGDGTRATANVTAHDLFL